MPTAVATSIVPVISMTLSAAPLPVPCSDAVLNTMALPVVPALAGAFSKIGCCPTVTSWFDGIEYALPARVRY